MHNIDLILTLTGGLAAALALGYLTSLLRLSPIVGYLLAGVVVGTHTPGFIADRNLAEQMAEIGVILLMFGVGLHFRVQDLLAVKRVALPGALVQISVATALGTGVSTLFGWGWQSGVIFGLCLSVASTVVLTRVLIDNRDLHSPTGHVSVGWLIVEDLFTVLVLVVLPALFGRAAEGSVLTALFAAALKVALLAGAIVVLGSYFIPRFFRLVARSSERELFTLTVLVTVLGIAVGSAKVFDVSMALGAFLAGMVVGRSEFSLRAATEALPMRDAFSVLFFVSVGMLLDPAVLTAHPAMVLATIIVIILGKSAAAFAIVVLLGYPIRTALGVSVALAQIGEFSFILAALGKNLGLLDETALHCLVAASIVSITLNPLLYRAIGPMNKWIENRPELARRLKSRLRAHLGEALNDSEEKRHRGPHAIIVGYGPTGRSVEKLLKRNGVDSTIVEMNIDTIKALADDGKSAVYGDAGRPETLEAAGIRTASSLILASSSIETPAELVRNARELNPAVRIFARTNYVHQLAEMREAGCHGVFSGEGEVALALIEEILRDIGVTSAQIYRERKRAYVEMFRG